MQPMDLGGGGPPDQEGLDQSKTEKGRALTSEGVAPNGLARTHMLILACMPSNLSVHFTQRLKIEIEMRER